MMPSISERSSTYGNSIGTSVTLWFPNIFKIIGVMTAAATSIRSRECFSAAALSAATKRSPAQTKNSGQGVDGRVPSNTADARWGRGWGGPGLIGGFAAGAIIGSALARPYGYPYAYYGYYAPAPVYYDYYVPAPAYYGYYGPRPYGCWRWRYGYRYRVC